MNPEAKEMTNKEFQKLIKCVISDMESEGMEPRDVAMDVAENMLFLDPRLRRYVRRKMPEYCTHGNTTLYLAESLC